MPEPNRSVLLRASAGDPVALERLILDQQGYIYSVALGLVRNPEDAADVLQEVCIRLARALPGFRGESRFTTWLYRLAVNASLDLLRRRGSSVSLDADEGVADRLTRNDRAGDPQQVVEALDAAGRVRVAVDRLPPAQRLALTLQYFEDLTYEDIAEIMDVPLNTVKSHIRRGKERLAIELADLAPTGS